MSSEHIGAAAATGAKAPAEIPERWSAARNTDLVVRLLRGEPLDAVARDSHVSTHELEAWRRAFLDGGTQSLKKRVDPEDRELKRVQAMMADGPFDVTFFIGGVDEVEKELDLLRARWPVMSSHPAASTGAVAQTC